MGGGGTKERYDSLRVNSFHSVVSVASEVPTGTRVLVHESSSSAAKKNEVNPDPDKVEQIVKLPRGGILVQTAIGGVQFGMPPETIKDSLMLGLLVPAHFVITGEMFDRVLGLNTAEFEFPAYFNFFCMKRKVTLIVASSLEDRIRTIFGETLIGPQEDNWHFDEDFPKGTDPSAFPNFTKEGYHLDSIRKTLKVDTLLDFQLLDANELSKPVVLGSGITVKYMPAKKEFRVRENRQVLASVSDHFSRPDRVCDTDLKWASFTIPMFGVTVLGCSHGFDPFGTTTGFVIWVNRFGMMVDPPPGSSHALQRMGIPPKCIEGVILTHCHADHDSGTFQKMLMETAVELYTTRTILNSFLRKYSAITGFDTEFLHRLFTFKPVCIGEPLQFHGGSFTFFYSFHTIPTIGFETFLHGEGIVYSADTNTNTHTFGAMREDGSVGERRYEQLMQSPLTGAHTLILHEAGVPPVHTPMEVLEALEDGVKDRMYLVHVTRSQVSPGTGLRVAGEWDTLEIVVTPPESSSAAAAADVRHLLTSNPLLRPVLECKTDQELLGLIAASEMRTFDKGFVLKEAGAQFERVSVIAAGVVVVRGEGWSHRCAVGDVLGEAALLDLPPQNTVVVADSAVQLYQLSTTALTSFFDGDVIQTQIRDIHTVSTTPLWRALSNNAVFRSMSDQQLFAFCTLFGDDARPVPNSLLLHASEQAAPTEAFMVLEGGVWVEYNPGESDELTFRGKNVGRGYLNMTVGADNFLCDVNAAMQEKPSHLTLKVTGEGAVVRAIPVTALKQFLDQNPGILLQLLDTIVVTDTRAF